MKYVCDDRNHLICVPYSTDNLHQMAQDLGIDRKNFKKNHYLIPNNSNLNCTPQIVGYETLVDIIRSPEHAEAFLSDSIKGDAAPSDYFLQTQIQYNGI